MRNTSLATYILVTVGIIVAGGAIYFGSILPFAKSKAYIGAERNLGNVRTVPEFIANFARPVAFRSPVGDEEIAKFLGSKILDVVSSIELPEADAKALAEYADGILFKDEVRHLMLSGHLYDRMWQEFGDDEYRALAEARFRAAHEIGQRLPTPLYALYNLYVRSGNQAEARVMADEIIRLWPKVLEIPGYFGR